MYFFAWYRFFPADCPTHHTAFIANIRYLKTFVSDLYKLQFLLFYLFSFS